MLDLLVRNGTVVTAEGSYPYDVAIQGGKVAAIGPHGTLGEAKETVDAAGKLVLPGLIDPHVHIHHPFKGSFAGDDFTSATRSAAFGGVTTVCDFAIQWDKTKSLTDTCALRKSQFEGQSITDYAFHACLTRSDAETIGELPGLIQGGIPSAKLYMTYSRQGRMSDDAALYEALRLTAQYGGIVGVHAENDAMCYYFSDAFKAAGKTSPHYFPLCKHNLVESEAVNRAIYLAKVTGGNLYIFHLSCKESLDILRKAQDEGVHVYAETCIHYLSIPHHFHPQRPARHGDPLARPVYLWGQSRPDLPVQDGGAAQRQPGPGIRHVSPQGHPGPRQRRGPGDLRPIGGKGHLPRRAPQPGGLEPLRRPDPQRVCPGRIPGRQAHHPGWGLPGSPWYRQICPTGR